MSQPPTRTLQARAQDTAGPLLEERAFVLTAHYDPAQNRLESNLAELAALLAEGWVAAGVSLVPANEPMGEGRVWGILGLTRQRPPTAT